MKRILIVNALYLCLLLGTYILTQDITQNRIVSIIVTVIVLFATKPYRERLLKGLSIKF